MIKETAWNSVRMPKRLARCQISYCSGVPTPVNADRTPDLTPLEGGEQAAWQNLVKGSVCGFRIHSFPGVTEDICVPILEQGIRFNLRQGF